jgi:predicted RNA-binding protein with PIN domain
MPLLIDGYNLLHVTGLFGRGTEVTALHGSREALLRFLAAALEPAERTQTTIVFDAAGAPPGLPKTITHDGVTVHFARDYADADAMLEELIAAHEAPRSLVVVSSDHRVQRAARRRRAKFIDSDRWYAELRTARSDRALPSSGKSEKPSGELSGADVAYWVDEFTDVASNEVRPLAADPPPGSGLDNPFPPGYGEELLDGPDEK